MSGFFENQATSDATLAIEAVAISPVPLMNDQTRINACHYKSDARNYS
jgi:hypothetical protein